MKPMTPKLPETLTPVDNFLKFAKPYLTRNAQSPA